MKNILSLTLLIMFISAQSTFAGWSMVVMQPSVAATPPTTYSASLTITDNDTTGDTFTLNSIAYDYTDSPVSVTDLPTATEEITYSGSNTAACTGDVTGASSPWTITGDAASVACEVTVASGTGYAGYPSTDGVPDSLLGTETAFGVAGTRVYARGWTATVDGTADAINLKYANTFTAINSVLCLYNDNSLVGVTDNVLGASAAWTGYLSLSVVSGKSLDFAIGDVLSFGACYNTMTGTNNFLKDSGDSAELMYNSAVWVGGLPPDPVTLSTGTGAPMTILRYTY